MCEFKKIILLVIFLKFSFYLGKLLYLSSNFYANNYSILALDINSKLTILQYPLFIDYKYIERTLPQHEEWWKRGTHRSIQNNITGIIRA